MAIINQYDKRSGITYVYESVSYWDKEKQQPRAKRKLIGKLDPETKEIISTDGRGKKRRSFDLSAKMDRKFFGATYLLDEISKKLGINSDLKACFPDIYEQILSIAYYMTLENNSPLYRFEKWNILHRHPYGTDIPSQRSSDLFADISEDAKNRFLKMFAERHKEKECWVYDTTSISSYSELLKQVQYGNNKENDNLGQINLALVYGKDSNLPFYYRKLAGNISDVTTVDGLLADFEALGFGKVSLVMDRGFYSEKNINALMKRHVKFLIATKTSLSYVKKEIDTADFTTFEHYNEQYELYSTTVPTEWTYSQNRPYKNDIITSKKRIYLHLYYNIDKATDDKKIFDRRLMDMRRELQNGKRKKENEAAYKKYFEVKETPVRGMQVAVNEEAVANAKRYFGFFALLSNEKMDSIAALELYRNKDVVEKAFNNIKDCLDLRRTLVSSEHSLNGKMFVTYIGLIYLSYIKKYMQKSGLFKDYTIQSLFDRLDVIECFECSGRSLRVGEITEKQKRLYEKLGVNPLS